MLSEDILEVTGSLLGEFFNITPYFNLAPLQTIIYTEVGKNLSNLVQESNYTSQLNIVAAEKQCNEFCHVKNRVIFCELYASNNVLVWGFY